MKNKTWDEFWAEYRKPSKAERWLISERDKIIRRVARSLNKKSRIRILEVGCGYASNSLFLSADKRFEVFCVDSSKTVVSKVKKIIKNTFLCDAKNLKFKNNYFDVVFSSGLIEHFKNPAPIIKEIIRVTKKGGAIISFVPGKYSLWQLRIKLYGKNWQHYYEEPYTRQKLNKILNYKNIKIIENGGLDPFSLNGALLKLFNFKLPIKWSFPSAYTEIYSIARKI